MMSIENDLHLPFCAIPKGLLEFLPNVGTVKKHGLGHVCTICLVATHKVQPLKSIFIYVMMGTKLENLLFASNHEFPTTTLVHSSDILSIRFKHTRILRIFGLF
jgi:hypothetical protein